MTNTAPENTATQAQARLTALATPKTGRVIDLSSGWFRGMPIHPAHPGFDVVTYRTPRGERNHGDLAFLHPDGNTIGYGFVSELVMGTMHTGTHVDAMCHVVCNGQWHGGGSLEDSLGDFGTLESDATELPTMVSRGVMLDIPAATGHDTLPSNYPVGPEELQQACDRQQVSMQPGTVVLIRTGQMKYWPDPEAMQQCQDAGVSLAGAQWLVERGVAAVGADTAAIEVAPSGVAGSPQPVHVFLIFEHGIPILEWVYLEELARDGIFEFLFIANPLRVRGATGSMLAPIAIV